MGNAERIISENPENWVVLSISHNGNTHHKVFGSWRGGYLDGDRWKLNSGVTKVEEDNTNYYFYGYSGSCYQCKKGQYGIATSYSASIVDKLIESASDVKGEIIIMDENTNWFFLNKDE